MKNKDRRSRRTEKALASAMIQLTLEKGFENTNVSEICQRADVGRSTFYAHFADKEDLLQGSIEGLKEHLEEEVCSVDLDETCPPRHPALAFCLPMLIHADGNRELFAAMLGQPCGSSLQRHMHLMWSDIVRANWKGADEVAVQALTGAFAATIYWWLTKDRSLTARQVEDRFLSVVSPML